MLLRSCPQDSAPRPKGLEATGMQQRMHRRTLVLLICAVFLGCVSVRAPLVADKDFPSAWGEINQLGFECKALDGTYLNEGAVVAAEGVAQPLSLTSVLAMQSSARAVTLNVHTRKIDQNGDSFITLRVVPDEDSASMKELDGCFCIKQTLACTQVSEKYWSLPNFGFGGSQQNVYFSIASDRSLVARLQNYHADVILLIPVFGIKEPWARFERVDR